MSRLDIYAPFSDGTVRGDKRAVKKDLITRDDRFMSAFLFLSCGSSIGTMSSLFLWSAVSGEAAIASAITSIGVCSAYTIKKRWRILRKKAIWMSELDAKKIVQAQKFTQQVHEEVALLGGTSHTHILALVNRAYSELITEIQEKQEEERQTKIFQDHFAALPADDPERAQAQELAEEWTTCLTARTKNVDTKFAELQKIAIELKELRLAQKARLALPTAMRPKVMAEQNKPSLLADEIDGIRHARKQLAI